jgi:hypothetical protein
VANAEQVPNDRQVSSFSGFLEVAISEYDVCVTHPVMTRNAAIDRAERRICDGVSANNWPS